MKNIAILCHIDTYVDMNRVSKFFSPDSWVVDLVHSENSLNEYDYIFPYNYQKILSGNILKKNVIIIHGSDLPKGRGWAPIFYTFFNAENEYVVSAIRAAERVDQGDLLIKIRLKLLPNYTANFLREIDWGLFLFTMKKVCELDINDKNCFIQKFGLGNYNSKRTPNQNQISLDSTIESAFNLLKAVEPQHPAYFIKDGCEYILTLTPRLPPEKKIELTVQYSNYCLQEIVNFSNE